MDARELFDEIHGYCVKHADPALATKYSRYFREGYDAYGLSGDLVESKKTELLGDERVTMTLILETAPLLLASGKYEETSFAIVLLKDKHEEFTAETFTAVSGWFDIGIINWAHSDIICGDLMPHFFRHGIIGLNDLAGWRTSPNKFKRRAAPVSMLNLLKTYDDYPALFAFIEPLMTDEAREVHQGVGWFLREAWKLKREGTEDYLLKWKNTAPRLIFQYATEKMTPEEKKRFRKDKNKK